MSQPSHPPGTPLNTIHEATWENHCDSLVLRRAHLAHHRNNATPTATPSPLHSTLNANTPIRRRRVVMRQSGRCATITSDVRRPSLGALRAASPPPQVALPEADAVASVSSDNTLVDGHAPLGQTTESIDESEEGPGRTDEEEATSGAELASAEAPTAVHPSTGLVKDEETIASRADAETTSDESPPEEMVHPLVRCRGSRISTSLSTVADRVDSLSSMDNSTIEVVHPLVRCRGPDPSLGNDDSTTPAKIDANAVSPPNDVQAEEVIPPVVPNTELGIADTASKDDRSEDLLAEELVPSANHCSNLEKPLTSNTATTPEAQVTPEELSIGDRVPSPTRLTSTEHSTRSHENEASWLPESAGEPIEEPVPFVGRRGSARKARNSEANVVWWLPKPADIPAEEVASTLEQENREPGEDKVEGESLGGDEAGKKRDVVVDQEDPVGVESTTFKPTDTPIMITKQSSRLSKRQRLRNLGSRVRSMMRGR